MNTSIFINKYSNKSTLEEKQTNTHLFNKTVDRINQLQPLEMLGILRGSALYSLAKSSVDVYRLAERVSPKLSLDRPATTAAGLFKKMLRSSDGICLGETHNQTAAKVLLQKNMAHLQKLGVNAFFVEGADLIDDAQIQEFNAGKTNDISWAYSNDQDTLITARQFGMKIYPIDCARGNSSPSRLLNLNFATLLKVEEIKRKDPTLRKYIVWVGERHTNTAQIEKTTIPGISELLNIPSLIVIQKKIWQKEAIREETNHPSLPSATANAIIYF